MKEIHGNPVKTKRELNTLEVYAQICYFYPAYTLGEASELSPKTIKVLLETAKRQRAIENMNQLRIVTAPNAKDKGYGKKLYNEFKAEAQ